MTKASIVIDEAVNAYIEGARAGGKAVPSCPISSLGSELARSDPSGTRAGRRNGIAAFATFVGALTSAKRWWRKFWMSPDRSCTALSEPVHAALLRIA